MFQAFGKRNRGLTAVDAVFLVFMAGVLISILANGMSVVLQSRFRTHTTIACRNLLGTIKGTIRTPEDLYRTGWQAGKQFRDDRCFLEIVDVEKEAMAMRVRYRTLGSKRFYEEKWDLAIAE